MDRVRCCRPVQGSTNSPSCGTPVAGSCIPPRSARTRAWWGSHRSLFSTSVGFQSPQYQLIDWDKNEKLWQIPAPGSGQVLAVGITPNILLFEEAELYKPGPWRGAE